jgi:hypothetical protein
MSRANTLDSNHVSSGIELHFRVMLWIDAHINSPGLSRRLGAEFNVVKSTACRWIAAYKAARGMA